MRTSDEQSAAMAPDVRGNTHRAEDFGAEDFGAGDHAAGDLGARDLGARNPVLSANRLEPNEVTALPINAPHLRNLSSHVRSAQSSQVQPSPKS
ncbi:MAG: hypothetical protein AAFQ11_08570, partial [Pseudomonadota bacterium]